MTIVVWDGKTLATDKMANDGSLKWESPKAWYVDNTIVSGVGLLQHIVLLREWLKKGGNEEDYPRHIINSSHNSHKLIVVNTDGLSVYDGVPVPSEFYGLEPCAFGHGREFALGAMEMGADARKAVEITNKYSLQCGKGVDIFTLQGGKA